MIIDQDILSEAKKECEEASLELYIEDEKVMVMDSNISQKPYFIDFTASYYQQLFRKKPSKKEPLAKALGSGSSALDLTAGTLKDSFYMALLGFHVTALERSPTIYLMLKSALDQLSKSPSHKQMYEFINTHINILYSEATSFLGLLNEKPDVIYFDPMFPEKKKQALSQKSMQIFKALLVADENENQKVASMAKGMAKKRFVTKRPLHAEALTPTVTQRYTGKSIRYDMVSLG